MKDHQIVDALVRESISIMQNENDYEGVDIVDLYNTIGLPDDLIDASIERNFKEGELYEPEKGRVRRLED